MPLFYFFLKFPVRLALMIFCREIWVRNGVLLKTRGPLLLVSNHPNSFLDAIIIGSLFSHPVHFLARGDAFKKPWHRRILGMMNMIPVYRMSEGRENLHLNSEAFRKSGEVLNAGGIVLIFIEGICVNKHELQTFKKGAARIANESKHLNNFKVMPIGIAYDSFQQFGKTINVEIGEPVLAKKLLSTDNTVANIVQFNEILRNEIEQKIEVPISKCSDQKKQQLLKPFSVLGFIIHIFLYKKISIRLRTKTKGTVFYDSVLFGTLLVIYPLIVIALIWLMFCLGVHYMILLGLMIFFPFTAWCAVYYKQK